MDAAPLTALVQTQAVRALLAQLGAGTQQNLLSLVGQDLEMTFLGMGAQGAQLALPGGQVVLAQGELPFAQGTQLMVRVILEAEGAVRLQIQEAKPPQSPAILQPLLAGEAQPLLAKLTAEEPAPSLAPLVRLLQQVLLAPKGEPIAPSTASSTTQALVTQAEEAVATLPAPLAEALGQALKAPSGQALAPALVAWVANQPPAQTPPLVPLLQDSEVELVQTPSTVAADPGLPKIGGAIPDGRVQETLMRAFSGRLEASITLPEAQRDLLTTFFKGLLAKAIPDTPLASGAKSPSLLPSTLVAELPEALAALPMEATPYLRQALGIAPEQPLATGLRSWMVSVLSPELSLPAQALEFKTAPEADPVADLGRRFEALLRQAPDFPKAQRSFVSNWFREVLVKAGVGEASGQSSSAALTSAPRFRGSEVSLTQSGASLAPETEALKPTSLALPSEALEEPAFWNKWVRGTVEALSDPQVSPREAPFHALQAKEGTAYFELPAPWLPQGGMQLWVESDARQGGRPEDGTRRVFMGLHLSKLGETRLGMELSGSNLRVGVWTEHPERLAKEEEALGRELAETGCAVSLRILPLGSGAPSLRSLAVGESWQGLG